MNLKLHIIATTIFVLLGIVILIATGRIHFGEQPAENAGEVARNIPKGYLQIDSASWGMNCMQFASRIPPFKPTKEDEVAPLPLRRDNVLRVVSRLCNGNESCEIAINEETLGRDPIMNCTKELRVEYRCEEMERVRRQTFFATSKPATLD
ncbi:MAG: hypothetical protein K2Q12_06275, partial [Rickettsiales bacterium]|nr:hypothetical protein [Rickettsiales bacterium]